MMRLLAILPAALFAVLAAGCASRADLAYRPLPARPARGNPAVSEVRVVDERGVPADQVGAVMGTDGKPLKRLQTEGSAADAVARAFRDALQARGDLAPSGLGRLDLEVTIRDLRGEQWAERHGETDLVISLVDRDTGHVVYTARTDVQSRGDNYLAIDNFELGSPAALSRVADAVFTRAIDDTVDRSGFLLALR